MNRYRMIVDGRPMEVDLTELGPGRYRAIVEGTVHDVTLRDGMATVSTAPAPAAMMPAPVVMPAPTARPAPAGAAASPAPAPAPRHAPAPAPVPMPAPVAAAPVSAAPTIAGAYAVTAPMPGKVVALGAKEGEKVVRGAAIITIEAMKMNVPIAATVDGTLARLAVKVGDAVQAGQLVAEIKA